jgi:hypothetical protein
MGAVPGQSKEPVMVRTRWWIISVAGALLSAAPLPAQSADDLAWVPANASGFLRLRVAELWKHDSTKELRERLVKAQLDVEKDIESQIGLRPSEIERVTLILPAPGKEPVLVITTAKPAEDKLLKALPGAVSKKKHKNKTYYESDLGEQAVYFADERLVLFGTRRVLLELLDRAGEKRAAGPLDEALKLAAGKAPLVGCLSISALAKQLQGGLPPQAQAALPLFDADPAVITLVSDADTTINAQLTCKDEQEAKTKAQTLRITLDILGQFILVGRTEIGRDPTTDELNRWLLKQADAFLVELQDGLKIAQVEASRRVVSGKLHVKTNAGTLLTLGAGFFSAQRSSPPSAKPEKP